MLSPEEARGRVLEAVSAVVEEGCAVVEAAGRVLARPAVAVEAGPPYDASEMDGFAVRAADVEAASEAAPVELRVVLDLPAGRAPSAAIGAGQAARIMTGGSVPQGADAIVPRERAREGRERVTVLAPASPGAHIRRRGEDFGPGDALLPAGAVVGPGGLALLISGGLERVAVRRRPVVAVLSTGDEVRYPGEPLAPGQIRNSNNAMISALIAREGATPLDLGIVGDDRRAIEAKVAEALEAADAVVTTGGVSVGDHDFTKEAFAAAGVQLGFWKVAMKPGKPFAFGVRGSRAAFGLPGNPASAFVTFVLLVAPALRKMLGRGDVAPAEVPVVLDEPVRPDSERRAYLRARVRFGDDGRLRARLAGSQRAGAIGPLARANALAIVPPGRQALAAGEVVKAHLLEPPEAA